MLLELPPGWIRRFQAAKNRPAFLRAHAYELRREAGRWTGREASGRLATAYAARVSASGLER